MQNSLGEGGGPSRSDPLRPAPTTTWGKLVLILFVRAVFNPRLAVALLSVAWAFRKRHWLTKFPFLPVPPTDYVRWRMYTAYGDESAVPPVSDVVRFAKWKREVMRV